MCVYVCVCVCVCVKGLDGVESVCVSLEVERGFFEFDVEHFEDV